ncbi:hypothetical protein BS47DRAFT_1351781 [Hydnum rufescens UP504]|uniref:Uncharacterized protein n=1 Tax=Hydnum rufescens UP504 TaxID=1448309 RepID=A0A9P6AK75_9AGAM|nr:hypothetical protein BS47DRAFT_1351781 [Hydnum rufescens UP504]
MSNSNSLHEIGLRIHTLSTVLSVLSRQVEVPDLSPSFHGSPTLQACNHFATLLTRGSEDSDNKGKGAGRRAIAVAGKLTSEVTQLTVSGFLDATDHSPNEPFNVEGITPQNASPDSIDVFQIQTIQPSETTLAKLGERDDPVKNDEGLLQYTQDLLAAIRDLRTSPSSNFVPFRRFVLRSCLANIGHRLDADQYLFPRALEDILGDWRPLPDETFEPKQVLVAQPYRQSLLDRQAPIIGNYCQWTPETAPQWIHLLRLYLVFAKTSVRRICTVSNTGGLTTKIDDIRLSYLDKALSLLLVIMALPLGDVFGLSSMRMLLSGQRDFPSAPDDVDDEDAPELPGADISRAALRYLGNVVAWHRATHYVRKGVRKHMGEISLTMVLTPASVSHRAYAPIDLIVEPAIVKALRAWGIKDTGLRASIIQMVKDKLEGKMRFTNAVHCEASLMGLIASSIVDVGPLPDYLTKATVQSTFKRLATEIGLATIGVGRKCCWCCAWLAKRLHLAHPEITFDIPQSHGQIFPWALPPVGVTVEDALALESELSGVLDRVMISVVQKICISIMRTQMSPPSGSISSPIASDLPEAPEVGAALHTVLDGLESKLAAKRLQRQHFSK